MMLELTHFLLKALSVWKIWKISTTKKSKIMWLYFDRSAMGSVLSFSAQSAKIEVFEVCKGQSWTLLAESSPVNANKSSLRAKCI